MPTWRWVWMCRQYFLLSGRGGLVLWPGNLGFVTIWGTLEWSQSLMKGASKFSWSLGRKSSVICLQKSKASVRFPSSLDRGEIWTWRVKTPERRGGAADIRAALMPQEQILDLYRVRAGENFSMHLFVEGNLLPRSKVKFAIRTRFLLNNPKGSDFHSK